MSFRIRLVPLAWATVVELKNWDEAVAKEENAITASTTRMRRLGRGMMMGLFSAARSMEQRSGVTN